MTKLDTSRPYGNIVGAYEECPGAVYTQDGNFFDGRQVLIKLEASSHEKTDERKNEERAYVQIDDDGEGQKENDEERKDEEIAPSLSKPEFVPDTPASDSLPETEPLPISVAEPELEFEPDMDATDQELEALADSGMPNLRKYAAQFGVRGVSKMQLINGLKALRI